MNKTWGYHLLLDCTAGKIDEISSKETHDAEKAGLSLCQMIETSNITGHFCDKDGNFYIDVFSCKPFSNDVVLDVVNKYFHPTKIRTHFISRDA